MKALEDISRRLLVRLAGLVPTSWLERFILRLVSLHCRARSPEEGLRLLLGLDNGLYAQTGPLAVAYGRGLHPKHRHTGYHDFFVERLRPGETVLDLGCGNGALSQDLAQRAGARVLGIDLSEDNIRQARSRYPHPRVEYRVGDALRDLPESSFHTVVLSNLLEHLPQREDFLRRLVRDLAPQRLLIRVPLFERDWRVPLKRELGLAWRADPTHQTEYTLESFRQEMTAAGLEIAQLQVRWGEIWAEVRARAS